ncbi:oligosaccharide flippase family protein [uncultured Paludibaculum sp.]|uniref:lipopolysaccharide biosynthesis protein n=1 Tax=uncultured Paludibaculum sp. TaxID=1765020 RepID=UPI002AAC3353|nr:oligosaccharide flippase family protein [uncultured Paludibaculum sp.]
MLSGVLQLIINVALLRQLGPAQSGIVFVFLNIIALCDGILGAALDVAVVKLATLPDQGHGALHSLQVQKTAMSLKWLACAGLAAPSILLAQVISSTLFATPRHSPLISVVVLGVAGLLTLRSVQTHFQIGRRFVVYGAADMLHSTLKFGSIAALIWMGTATPARVLWCVAAAPALVTVCYLAGPARSLAVARFTRPAARELLEISKWYVGGAATGTMTSKMDILLVSSLAGSAQAGIYSAAQNLTIPFQLLGQYLSVVFTPRIMPLWKTGRLSKVYWLFQCGALLFCLAGFAAFFAGIGLLIPGVLPATYLPGVAAAKWLLPAALASILNFPWTVPFLMFTHPRFLFVMDAVALVALSAIYYFAIGDFGAVGAAAVTTGYALLKTGIFQSLAFRTMQGPCRP